MKSLTEQVAEAKEAEWQASRACDDINDQLYAAQQIVARLETERALVLARYHERRKEREAIQTAIQRERLFQSRRRG